MNRPAVLLIATTTGYQTRVFDEAAERVGVDLLLATDRCHVLDDPWRDAAIPIRFHEPEQAVQAIVASASQRSLTGVLALGDRPVEIAAIVADHLDLPWHPIGAASTSRNKLLARACWQRAGLHVPWHRVIPLNADLQEMAAEIFDICKSCVVKPAALWGSRGVIRADSPLDFIGAVERVRRLLSGIDVRALRDDATDTLIVERFIPGREFAVEGLFSFGKLQVLAIFDKPDPLDGPFFEETLYVTPPKLDAPTRDQIETTIEQAARAMGLFHGPIHAECRLNDAGVHVLEIAARPIGGLCARALRFGRRMDLHRRPQTEVRGLATGDQGPAYANATASDKATASLAEASRRRTAWPRRNPLNGFPANEGGPETGDRGPETIRSEMSLEELLLRHAAGQDVSHLDREKQASGVMMIPIPCGGVFREASGIVEALAVDHIEGIQITATPGQAILPLPEGASYLGFIFARADRRADVERALRLAHQQLSFRVDPAVPVAP